MTASVLACALKSIVKRPQLAAFVFATRVFYVPDGMPVGLM